MAGAGDLARLVARAEDDAAEPSQVRAALDELLDRDPALGCTTALGLLAREPRVKPSTALVIDPGDEVARRWAQRVEAARALLASPAGVRVQEELRDELADCPDLDADVRAAASPGHRDATARGRGRRT